MKYIHTYEGMTQITLKPQATYEIIFIDVGRQCVTSNMGRVLTLAWAELSESPYKAIYRTPEKER